MAHLHPAQSLEQRRRVWDDRAHILNAHIDGEVLAKSITLTKECEDLILKAAEKFHLSARGYFRTLKVARTIADMEGAEIIQKQHLSEAIQYRTGY